MAYPRLILLSLILGLITVTVKPQTTDLNQTLTSLQGRVDFLTLSSANLLTQINQLNAQLQAAVAQEAADRTALNGSIIAIQGQITPLASQSKSNAAGIAEAKASIAGLKSSVDTLSLATDKLENANRIWKANFQVVNSTFAELRKKLKMVAPFVSLPIYTGR